MIHISVIVWALCMLQSVSAFAPEPSSENMVSAGISIPKIFGEEAGALAARRGNRKIPGPSQYPISLESDRLSDPCVDFNFFSYC